MKYGKYWFHLQKIFFIASLHVLGLFIPKKQVETKKKFRLARVAVQIFDEICMHDISAVLRATDFRFRLPLSFKLD
jgi:hypothetical protein